MAKKEEKKEEKKKELSPLARFGRGMLWFAALWAVIAIAVLLTYGGLVRYHETDEHPEEMLAVTAGPKINAPITAPIIDFIHLGDRVDTRPVGAFPSEDELLQELAKPLDSGPLNAAQQRRKKDREAKAKKKK